MALVLQRGGTRPAALPSRGQDGAEEPSRTGALVTRRRGPGGALARRLGVDQSFRPTGVETKHPVTKALKADPRRSAPIRAAALARAAVIDLRQGQKPAKLDRIARALRQNVKFRTIKIITKRHGGGHGKAPFAVAMANHTPS
jgi:hypothetical protein